MTHCPYCNSDSFKSEAIRADAIDQGYADRYGLWFNQCIGCLKWSLFDNDQQLAIDNPETQPEPHSIKAD